MTADYSLIKPLTSFGGSHQTHNGNYLLSQCQHVLTDDYSIFVSMLIHRNVRMLDYKDGTFKRDISRMGFSDAEFEMAAGMCFYKGSQILITDLNANKILAFDRVDLTFLGLL